MSSLRRVWNAIRRVRLDDDLRQDVEAHLAEIEAEELARGFTAEEARHNARLRFGNALLYANRRSTRWSRRRSSMQAKTSASRRAGSCAVRRSLSRQY